MRRTIRVLTAILSFSTGRVPPRSIVRTGTVTSRAPGRHHVQGLGYPRKVTVNGRARPMRRPQASRYHYSGNAKYSYKQLVRQKIHVMRFIKEPARLIHTFANDSHEMYGHAADPADQPARVERSSSKRVLPVHHVGWCSPLGGIRHADTGWMRASAPTDVVPGWRGAMGLKENVGVARLAGIEPATLGFGGQYSIH